MPLSEAVRDTIKGLLPMIDSLSVERVWVIHPVTGKILHTRTDGRSDGVEVEREWNVRGMVVLHNHPDRPSPPSPTDIESMLGSGAGWEVVVTSKYLFVCESVEPIDPLIFMLLGPMIVNDMFGRSMMKANGYTEEQLAGGIKTEPEEVHRAWELAFNAPNSPVRYSREAR